MIRNPVLGAIIGDIVGSTYEFYRGHVDKTFALFTSFKHISDDSIMTLAVAKWLLDDKQDLVGHLQKFGRKHNKREYSYGPSFRKWLQSDDPKPYNSWGNGSAMRVSAVSCVAKSMKNCLELAKQSAEVTHNHPEGIKGAQAVAAAILLALNGEHKEYIKEYIEETFEYNLSRSLKEISNKGFKVSCQESVPEAIICFLLSDSYEDTIRNAIMLRGDTDTQACIAGSIAAAYWGIPEDIANEGVEYLPDDLYDVLNDFTEKFIK